MSYAQYAAYAPFAGEWLNSRPAHWTAISLKYLAKMRSGEAITSDRIEAEGDYPVYGGNGTRGFTDGYTHDGVYALIGRQGALCGNINLTPGGRFWASEHAVVVVPRPGFHTAWLAYLLQAMNLGQYSQSAAQPGLSVDAVSRVLVPVPSPPEQDAIIHFLDRETAKIDELIAKQNALIELLAERRKAVITRAVTKGLDPNVPMKDSGIAWSGPVPYSWRIAPLRWYARCRSGSACPLDTERTATTPIPAIGGNGVTGFSERANTMPGSSLVIGRVGALCGNVHMVESPSWVTDNALQLIHSKGFSSKYLLYVLRSRGLNEIANKTAQPLITSSQVLDQVLPLPSLPEQDRIVGHLEETLSMVDLLVATAGAVVDLLRERRSALITAAVTGKIDVRGAA